MMVRMGSESIPSVKWSISIDTMMKFDGDVDGNGDGMCKQALLITRKLHSFYFKTQKHSCSNDSRAISRNLLDLQCEVKRTSTEITALPLHRELFISRTSKSRTICSLFSTTTHFTILKTTRGNLITFVGSNDYYYRSAITLL